MTLARLPRQKLAIPCSAATRVKQLPMPASSTEMIMTTPSPNVRRTARVARSQTTPTCVPCDLSRLDPGIGVLGLQEQLHALNRGDNGFGQTAGCASCQQIRRELDSISVVALDLGLYIVFGCLQGLLGLVNCVFRLLFGSRDQERCLLPGVPAGG